MKKKTRLLILSVIATLAFSGAMASCGDKSSGGNVPSSSSDSIGGDSSDVVSGDSSDVGSDESSDVGSDESSDVGSDESSDVGSDESSDVGSDESSDVGSDESSDVGSDESSDVGSDDSSDVGSGDSSDVSSDDSSDDGSDAEDITIVINGSATMREFETLALVGNVLGAEEEVTLTWSSSDETIATVDANGVVTAYKAGFVTITASAGDVSATHELTVDKTNILHEIEFDIPEVKIYEGYQKQVVASVVFDGETLDDEEYGIEYTWEKVSGDDVAAVTTEGATSTFKGTTVGTAVYKVSTTVRGYDVEKTISVTVMENEYSYDIPNEKLASTESGYKTTLTFGAVETEELVIGTVYGVLNGEPQEDELTVEWATESDVIAVNGDKITAVKAGEGVLTGTTEYGNESLTITLTVVVEKGIVALQDQLMIETVNAETITLPEAATTNVEKVTLSSGVLFDAANGVGSIDGSVVTVDQAGLPCKEADLGKGKTLTIETDKMIYSTPIDVYTMIINNAEELDQWQAVAADNAIKAGICIEAQRGLVYSGYFILGDDIEYNKVWTPYLPYAGVNPSLYGLCYQNPDIWADPSQYEAGPAANTAALVDGAIVEDWGRGINAGFKGTFDGDGHYIAGMKTSGLYSGFIITMGGGTVKNIAFTDAKIGAGAGLVANRGQGNFENIFVEVAEMESGADGANYTHVIIRNGIEAQRSYNNILVDLSKVDVENLEYAYVIDMATTKANGVYVVGAADMLLARGKEEWSEGSTDTTSWTATEACAFWHYLEGDDTAAVYGSVADLLADEAAAAVVGAWDEAFWTVTDNAVVHKAAAHLYNGAVAITNEETSVHVNTSMNITTDLNKAYVAFTLKEEVAGVTVVGDKVSVAEEATVGATFTVVATSLVDGSKVAERQFTVAPKIVELADTMTVETYNNDTITLPDSVSGTVSKITIGSTVVYDVAKAIGSIDGKTVTVGTMPVAMSDLGDEVAMTVETDEAKYEMSVSVYTMVIDNAEELDQWQEIAAQNAIDAGLCIDAQKGFVYSGYFKLGADIEYNKSWKSYLVGEAIWNLYGSDAWKAAFATKEVKEKSGNNILYTDGSINEDWGAGYFGGFRGVFDGDGHAIKGMTIDEKKYAGFIGTMGRDGVMKDIAFTDLKLGQTAGLVERGGNGGFVENVYIELDAIESGLKAGSETKLMTVHGHTKFTNIIVNVTECDFTGIEYAYLLNSAYHVSENIYVIDRDYLQDTKQNFNTDAGASAFLHFSANSDKGGKFATVEALLADEAHGAVVSSLGGYWKVEDGKLYFGDTQVVTAPEKEFDLTEYKTDVNKQVTLANEAFTVDSVWSVSINGGEAVEYTVTEEGKAILTVDPATLDSYQAKIVLSNADKVLSYSNVIAVTYITTAEELQAVGMGENNLVATDNDKKYYALANNITFEHADDYSDVVAAGYHKAGGTSYSHLWSFQGVLDGNGYTIDNMRVSDGGILGYAENATIKNLTLKNVHLIDNVPESISKQKGCYAGILAYTAPGSTFENIQITMASSPAGVWTYKRDGLFVVSSSNGGATYRDITVDASYIELKTLLGISHKDSNVYEDVLIKGASYVAIGYTADSYTTDANDTGVQNTAALMTEFPDGVKFETVAHAVIPNQPLDTNLQKLTAYDGDVTALGFAEGTNVFAITADSTGTWNNRIVFPADSDNYDYVEFDVILSTDISSFTAWPSNGNNTQGSMNIYGAQMQTSDSLVRTVQVFDKDGNTFASQYADGFKANTLYTIRACFTKNETVKYFHLGMGTAQTYYVTNARWGTFGTQNDVYTSGTGALLAKYDGDVTALGFEEGSTVTQATLTDAWSNRVGINTSIKYDYVDVEFSFTGDCTVSSLCVWAYGTDAKILTGNYTVSASGSAAANNASERTVQILGADGNAVTELTANTVYTLRVYLNGDASSIAVSTFDTSAESTAILNFGDITFGNDA